MIASRVSSLNKFIVLTIPIEIICFIPPIFDVLIDTKSYVDFYPFNVCISLVSGDKNFIVINILILVSMTIITYFITYYFVCSSWKKVGGVKL